MAQRAAKCSTAAVLATSSVDQQAAYKAAVASSKQQAAAILAASADLDAFRKRLVAAHNLQPEQDPSQDDGHEAQLPACEAALKSQAAAFPAGQAAASEPPSGASRMIALFRNFRPHVDPLALAKARGTFKGYGNLGLYVEGHPYEPGEIVCREAINFEPDAPYLTRLDKIKSVLRQYLEPCNRWKLSSRRQQLQGDKYLILQKRGSGNKAVVYSVVKLVEEAGRLRVPQDAEPVAWKVLKAKMLIASTDDMRGAATGSMHLSKYAAVHTVGVVGVRENPDTDDVWPCLCLEMEEAVGSLQGVLQWGIGCTRLTDCDFANVSIEYAATCMMMALEDLHAKNIRHRGVKLSNLLWCKDGTCKLAGWSMSKDYTPDIAWAEQLDTAVMETPAGPAGGHCGMSLEQHAFARVGEDLAANYKRNRQTWQLAELQVIKAEAAVNAAVSAASEAGCLQESIERLIQFQQNSPDTTQHHRAAANRSLAAAQRQSTAADKHFESTMGHMVASKRNLVCIKGYQWEWQQEATAYTSGQFGSWAERVTMGVTCDLFDAGAVLLELLGWPESAKLDVLSKLVEEAEGQGDGESSAAGLASQGFVHQLMLNCGSAEAVIKMVLAKSEATLADEELKLVCALLHPLWFNRATFRHFFTSPCISALADRSDVDQAIRDRIRGHQQAAGTAVETSDVDAAASSAQPKPAVATAAVNGAVAARDDIAAVTLPEFVGLDWVARDDPAEDDPPWLTARRRARAADAQLDGPFTVAAAERLVAGQQNRRAAAAPLDAPNTPGAASATAAEIEVVPNAALMMQHTSASVDPSVGTSPHTSSAGEGGSSRRGEGISGCRTAAASAGVSGAGRQAGHSQEPALTLGQESGVEDLDVQIVEPPVVAVPVSAAASRSRRKPSITVTATASGRRTTRSRAAR